MGDIHQPSPSELEILQALWENEPATVRTIHEIISQKKSVGYTTILKQMQRMTDKKMVERYKKGKTHFYKAVSKETDVQQSLFKRLLNGAFGGSPMKLVMHALGQSETSKEELDALQEWLKQQQDQQNLQNQ